MRTINCFSGNSRAYFHRPRGKWDGQEADCCTFVSNEAHLQRKFDKCGNQDEAQNDPNKKNTKDAKYTKTLN
jgi:hypothetical protein